jgi:hypothetical protein
MDYVDKGKVVTDYISPVNAMVGFFTLVLLPALDFLTPIAPILSYFAIVAASFFIALVVLKIFGKPSKNLVRRSSLIVGGVCASIFAIVAYASNSNKSDGGLLASKSQSIRTLQASLLKIEANTEAINKKLDRTNFMLAQLLADARPHIEKVLIDEVKGYQALPQNKKDALIYFSSKVGVNGVKKYRKLLTAINTYEQSPTTKEKAAIVSMTRSIVEVNGKRIEDDKTRLFVLAMFFEPATFEYLIGGARPQQESELLKEFQINPAIPAESQINDPLYTYVTSLRNQGIQVEEKTVIPKEQTETATSGKKRIYAQMTY